jgi:hypothetical protein
MVSSLALVKIDECVEIEYVESPVGIVAIGYVLQLAVHNKLPNLPCRARQIYGRFAGFEQSFRYGPRKDLFPACARVFLHASHRSPLAQL